MILNVLSVLLLITLVYGIKVIIDMNSFFLRMNKSQKLRNGQCKLETQYQFIKGMY
jgi:uncharacterized membrane protein